MSVVDVIGSRITCGDVAEVCEKVILRSKAKMSSYICLCNVHSVVLARLNDSFSAVVNAADSAIADGAPVAWMMRCLGCCSQKRISGPDLMLSLCERAAAEGVSVYCYGSTPETLDRLRHNLLAAYPALRLTVESPPFRPLTVEEDTAVVERINASGAGLVFVGLGCPKQERWMAEHRGRIHAVMLGVGAAFDFHAGTVRRAPRWMQEHGLEWLHRLCSEPRRLWKRYLVTNTVFLVLAAWQLLRQRRR